MPRLETVGNVEVRIYFHDTDRHKSAHFHAVSPDREALVSIPDCQVLAGALRAKDLARVTEWAQENQDLLVAEWNRCNPHQPI